MILSKLLSPFKFWTHPFLDTKAVKRLMRLSDYDTKDIADRYGLSEAEVWNILGQNDRA